MKRVLVVILLLGVVAAVAEAGIVSYWPMEGNAADIIGSNEGVLSAKSGGTLPVFEQGRFGQAVRTTGNGYVDCGSGLSLNPTGSTGVMSVAAWVKTSELGEGYSPIFGKSYANSYRMIQYAAYGQAYWGVRMVGTSSSAVIEDGQWHHLVGTYDGKFSRLYVDGVPSLIAAPNMVLDPYPFLIGSVGDQLSYHTFDGLLDDVIFFDTVLTAADVAKLMSDGAALVAHYEMEDGSGSTVADSSILHLDGDVVGDPTWVTGRPDYGLAMEFDGNDSVNCGNDPNRAFSDANSISLAAIVNFTSADTGTIISKGSSLGLFQTVDGKVSFVLGTGTLTSAAAINDGLWHSVIGTYDGNRMTLYIDSLEDSNDVTGSYAITPDNIVLGDNFVGQIDDVRIYVIALQDYDVRALAASFVNQPPTVSAYADVYSTWLEGGSATINIGGDVSDDGKGSGPLTTLWDDPNGPAAVVFGNSTEVETTATFDTAGTYVLTLTADDGELQGSDSITITIYPEGYQGLISHWKFDDGSGTTAADSEGTNDGTIVGPTTYWTTGQVGGALDLVDNSTHVNCGNSADFNLTNEMTVAIWIKGSFTNGYEGIFSKGYGTWRLIRYAATGSVCFQFGYGSLLTCSTAVDDGKWHHIVVTYNGMKAVLYVDGQQENSLAGSNLLVTGGNNLWIGSCPTDASAGWNGEVDSARIYKLGLSKKMVEALYFSEGGSPFEGCTVYRPGDLNMDCYVNLLDFSIVAGSWLECTEVSDPECAPYLP